MEENPFEIFNKISFCPKCFLRGEIKNHDHFLFYSIRNASFYILEIYDTDTFFDKLSSYGPMTKGFTPHIVSFIKEEDHFSFLSTCSICQNDDKEVRNDLFDIHFKYQIDISLKRFVEIRERCF